MIIYQRQNNKKRKRYNIIDFYNDAIKDNYKDYMIIMNNAVIHKSKIVRQTIQESGNYLLYSVPYYSETNAIKKLFSQLKHYIKKQSQNTYDNIQSVIKDMIKKKINKEHLRNYLKHSFRLYKKN